MTSEWDNGHGHDDRGEVDSGCHAEDGSCGGTVDGAFAEETDDVEEGLEEDWTSATLDATLYTHHDASEEDAGKEHEEKAEHGI